MRLTRRTRLLVALGLACTVAGSGCSGARHTGRARSTAPAVLPLAGGTLRVVTSAPIVWADSSGVPTAAGAELSRLSARQLVSLDGVDSLGDRADPIFDLTPFADPSDDKLTVSLRMRDVRYGPPYDGSLRAADVVFGLELLCDPAHPDADSELLAAALVGYAEFCAGMRTLPNGEAGVTAYADSHPVAGLAATAVDTVTLRLLKPEGDLLDMLTLPDMTPFPESAFAPAIGVTTWVQAPSLGPYLRSTSGSGFIFTRNPVWDATQDPLRRAWVDRVVVTSAGSVTRARAAVDRGSADVLLDDNAVPGDALSLPVVPPGAATSITRTTPAGDVIALLPLRSSPGRCTAALADPAVRQALVVGLDHRPVAAALGGPQLADARDWPLPGGFVGGTGAPPVIGRSVGADGPGTVPVPIPPLGATAGLGGDPGTAKLLLAAAGASRLTCSLSAVDPASGAPDPRLLPLLPAVAEGLRGLGIIVRIRTSGPADLALERLSAPWRGDGAGHLLAPLVAATTDITLQAAVARAEAEADQNLASTQWAAVATLLLDDGDIVPIAEQRVQSLTSPRVRGFRWFGLGNGIDLANAALAGG